MKHQKDDTLIECKHPNSVTFFWRILRSIANDNESFSPTGRRLCYASTSWLPARRGFISAYSSDREQHSHCITERDSDASPKFTPLNHLAFDNMYPNLEVRFECRFIRGDKVNLTGMKKVEKF